MAGLFEPRLIPCPRILEICGQSKHLLSLFPQGWEGSTTVTLFLLSQMLDLVLLGPSTAFDLRSFSKATCSRRTLFANNRCGWGRCPQMDKAFPIDASID